MATTISLYVCAEVQSDNLDADYWQNSDAYQAFVVSLDPSDPDEAVRQVEKAAKHMGLGPSDAGDMARCVRQIIGQMAEH